MPRKEFQPPRYEGRLHILFDKNTGEILAKEQRWMLVGVRPGKKPRVRSELLEQMAREAGKGAEEVDIMILDADSESKRAIRRIDVRERRPIFDEPPAEPGRVAGPRRTLKP